MTFSDSFNPKKTHTYKFKTLSNNGNKRQYSPKCKKQTDQNGGRQRNILMLIAVYM